MRRNNARALLLMLLLTGLALAFRLYKLDCLPGWNFDEGRWALGAVSKIRYHNWLRGGWHYGFVSPVWTGLIYLDFLALGSSIVHARYLTVLFGTACIPLLYGICRRCGYGRRVALLSALFLSFDTYFSVANRQALTDTALTAFLTASFFTLLGNSRQRYLSPIFLAAAIGTKATAIFGAAVMYISAYYSVADSERKKVKSLIKPAAIPLCGVIIAAIAFYLIYIGHPNEFLRGWSYEFSLRKSNSGAIFDPFAREGLVVAIKFYLLRMPFLLLAGAIGLFLMIVRRAKMHTLPLAWMICGLLVVVGQNSQPARYYLPVLPALCIMAAWAVDYLFFRMAFLPKARARYKIAGIAAVCIIMGYSLATWSAYYIITKHTDNTGTELTAWINNNLKPSDRVMGISIYGTSANVDYYPQDYYNWDYNLDDKEVKKLDLDYVLYDDGEWKHWSQMRNLHVEQDLQKHFVKIKKIGLVEIWRRADVTTAGSSNHVE